MHLIKLLTGTVLAGALLAGCNSSQSSQDQLVQQGCTIVSTHGHVCDPADTKKTTVCHIPPGNPANAHTICIGNEAVQAHIQNHGDFIGECSCPSDGGTGGGGDDGGGGGGGGDTPDAGTSSGSDGGGIVL